MNPHDDLHAQRLLAHIMTADTRWFKVSNGLLEFGRKNVPENRDSHNPVKWVAAEIGVVMDRMQVARTNRRFDKANGLLPDGLPRTDSGICEEDGSGRARRHRAYGRVDAGHARRPWHLSPADMEHEGSDVIVRHRGETRSACGVRDHWLPTRPVPMSTLLRQLFWSWYGHPCPECSVRPRRLHKAQCPIGKWGGGRWA